MLMACLFLYLEIRRFGGFGTVPGRVAAIERPAQTCLADRCGTDVDRDRVSASVATVIVCVLRGECLAARD